MRRTVEQVIGGGDIDVSNAQALEHYVNQEARPALRQLINKANCTSTECLTADSDGAGTSLTLWTSPDAPKTCTWTLRARVLGRSISNAIDEQASFRLERSFKTVNGVITALDATTINYSFKSGAGITADIVLVGNLLTVDVTDHANGAMRWVVVVETDEVLVK